MPLVANRICADSRDISYTWGQIATKVLLPYRAHLKCFQMCAVHVLSWKRDCVEACLPCFRRLFGGLVLDIKRKAPWYWSDYRDALSLQCLASFLFLYCACMSPVITFGGLLGEATEGRIVRNFTHF